MASYPKFGCLFFLLITLLFSIQTHARDIQHFSKVTRNRDTAPATTNPTTYINPNENEFEVLNNQEESQEQPAFIPQTTETGYGLYGHETGLESPSTPTTTTLYNMDQDNNNKYENFNNNKFVVDNNNNNNNYENFNNNNNKYENFNNNNNKYENFNNYYKNNNNENHEKNYATELTGLSDTTYTNVAPSKYFSNNNNNNGVQGKVYGGAGYNGVRERQGMSDTRFLENGKYFYDLENEKFSADHPNNNYMSYSNNYNNNNYNTNGYYGNKENNFEEFDNNNNNNNFYNGKQNQFPEEEFDFDQP